MERETVTGANWSVTTLTWLSTALLYLFYFLGWMDWVYLNTDSSFKQGLHTPELLKQPPVCYSSKHLDMEHHGSQTVSSLGPERKIWAGYVNREHSSQPAVPSSKAHTPFFFIFWTCVAVQVWQQHWWTKSIINARGFTSALSSTALYLEACQQDLICQPYYISVNLSNQSHQSSDMLKLKRY